MIFPPCGSDRAAGFFSLFCTLNGKNATVVSQRRFSHSCSFSVFQIPEIRNLTSFYHKPI